MSTPPPEQEPSIAKLLGEYVAESLELRTEAKPTPVHATAVQISELLYDVRLRLDRVEELLHRTMSARAALHRKLAAVRDETEDAWDEALLKAREHRGGPVVAKLDEYSSAKERHAVANLSVLEARREVRAATRAFEHADTAVDLIRLSHRALERIRQDYLAVLRALQWESTLDR